MAQMGAAVAAAAAGAALLLWVELQKQCQEQQQQAAVDAGGGGTPQANSRRRSRQQQPQPEQSQSHQSPLQKQLAASCPAAADIPTEELAALHAYLKKVYRWRGWQGGSYHIVQAWHQVEAAAADETHGGWQQHFDMRTLRDGNCDALLQLIDQQFFGGKLLRKLACKEPLNSSSQASKSNSSSTGMQVSPAEDSSHGAQQQQQSQPQPQPPAGAAARLHCKVVQNIGPYGTWLAYFDPEDNAVRINHWRWNKDISSQRPINCEGVVCTSRLQVLLHTLAHELVHAVVYHVFPEMDRASAAYLARDRHGPIFQLLNKQLFGHSSNALEEAMHLAAGQALNHHHEG